ncbi:MAG: ribosome-associated translation inhibitor RaiA [Acidimicrobiia bacterium]|nr:ribosome-associated translation inhibitor RaiA [Acidimicrobiia bacterium]MYD05167.1 ribosome-associated translation inhibitor RaiA [Acidimicrobiia bacterium]
MEVRLSGPGIRFTEQTRARAVERVSRTAKFFDRLGEVNVHVTRINRQGKDHRFRAELSTRAAGQDVRAVGEGDTVIRSVETASKSFERRLRRLSQRLHDRRRRYPKPDLRPPAGNRTPTVEEETGSMSRVRWPVGKPMTPEDAALVLDEQRERFLLFSNLATGQINVLHRLPDGGLELIEPD